MSGLSSRYLGIIRSLAYVSILFPISLCPLPVAYRLACLLGRLHYHLVGARRDPRVAEMMRRLGTDRARAERWLERWFEFAVCDDLECWLIPRLTKASLDRVIRFEGLANLDAALAGGKGVVLYSGHIKGSRLCIVGLALSGYRIALARGAQNTWRRDPIRRRFYDRYRKTIEERPGCRFLFADRQGVGPALAARSVSALRKNEIVALKPDVGLRYAHPGDVDVEFLNGEATFRPGGVQLARSTGAPLVSVWIHRPANLLPSVCTVSAPENVTGEFQLAVQHQAERLEAEIRADPPCWNAW